MSYDLAVYALRAAADYELRDLVAQVNGGDIEQVRPHGLIVVRGARQLYSISVEGSAAVPWWTSSSTRCGRDPGRERSNGHNGRHVSPRSTSPGSACATT